MYKFDNMSDDELRDEVYNLGAALSEHGVYEQIIPELADKQKLLEEMQEELQDRKRFVLIFDDQDLQRPIFFSGHGGEEAAIKTFELKSASCSCTLFQSIKRSPKY